MTLHISATASPTDAHPLLVRRPLASQVKSYIRSFGIRLQVLVLLYVSLLAAFSFGYLLSAMVHHSPGPIDSFNYFSRAAPAVATQLTLNQYQLTPILLLASFLTTLLSFGDTWVFRTAVYGAGALGYFATRLPASPFTFPFNERIYTGLYNLNYWCVRHIPVSGTMPILAIILLNWAYSKQTRVSIFGPYGLLINRPKEDNQFMIIAKISQIILIPISLIATAWATSIISLTMTSGRRTANSSFISHQAANAQNKGMLLLLFVAIVAIVAYFVAYFLLSYDTLSPLWLALFFAFILGIETKMHPSLQIFPFVGTLGILNGSSIGDPFWIAILIYLPIIAVSIHVIIKLRDWDRKDMSTASAAFRS